MLPTLIPILNRYYLYSMENEELKNEQLKILSLNFFLELHTKGNFF